MLRLLKDELRGSKKGRTSWIGWRPWMALSQELSRPCYLQHTWLILL
jgi:hypothetical protein